MTVSASQGKALWEQEHPAPGIGAPAAAPPPRKLPSFKSLQFLIHTRAMRLHDARLHLGSEPQPEILPRWGRGVPGAT